MDARKMCQHFSVQDSHGCPVHIYTQKHFPAPRLKQKSASVVYILMGQSTLFACQLHALPLSQSGSCCDISLSEVLLMWDKP